MLIAVTEQWVLTLPTQNHFIVEGTLSGFRRLCSMVYTHIAAMFVYYLHTWRSCLFICLTYPCSLSCLAQLCALYKSKTNKLQVLVAAVGSWTHFGEIHPPTLPIIHMSQLLSIFYFLYYRISWIHQSGITITFITTSHQNNIGIHHQQMKLLDNDQKRGQRLVDSVALAPWFSLLF